MNKVTLIGRLGNDPELKHSQNGNAICNFNMATSEKWKNRDGEQQERTEWHRCVSFGKMSEIISKYVRKGDQFCVEGEIQYQKYTDSSGVEKWSTQIVVRNFEFIGGKRQENNDDSGGYQAPPDNDIPF